LADISLSADAMPPVDDDRRQDDKNSDNECDEPVTGQTHASGAPLSCSVPLKNLLSSASPFFAEHCPDFKGFAASVGKWNIKRKLGCTPNAACPFKRAHQRVELRVVAIDVLPQDCVDWFEGCACYPGLFDGRQDGVGSRDRRALCTSFIHDKARPVLLLVAQSGQAVQPAPQSLVTVHAFTPIMFRS
jgi:hypothetical protein